MKKNTIWIILGVLAFGSLIGYAVIKQKNQKKGLSVKVTKVKKRTINEMVGASGKIYPVKEIKISSDVSGEIVELYVQEGDSVIVGQILAKIDPDSYTSAVERGVAGLNNAKAAHSNSKSQIGASIAQKEQIIAQLENANSIHKRNIQLKKEGVISIAQFEQSYSNVKALEANLKAAKASVQSSREATKGAQFSVKSAEASLKELKTHLKKTTIVSPTNGIISSLSVEQGERVVGTIQMTGTEMMRIANLQEMQVDVEISENDILKITLNDTVDIEVDAYTDKIFKGHVVQIANSAANAGMGSVSSNQVTNFIVEISMHNSSYKSLVSDSNPFPFRPGMSASVNIYTDVQSDVISVPIQSVTIRDINEDIEIDTDNEDDVKELLKEGVFVLAEDTVKFVIVESGLQDDEFIQIKGGLSVGETVVKGPYSAISKKLETGKVVKIKKNRKKKKR